MKNEEKSKHPEIVIRIENKNDVLLQDLISNLSCTNKRLNRLEDLKQRLTFAGQDANFNEIVTHLLQKKSALIKEIKELQDKNAKTDSPDTDKRDDIRPVEGGKSGFGDSEIEEIEHAVSWLDRQNFMREVARCSNYTFRRACRPFDGYEIPFLSDSGSTISGVNSINHDSSANASFGGQSYIHDPEDLPSSNRGMLEVLSGGILIDDAGTWRFDNPDKFMWYDSYCFYLPAPGCDSVATIDFYVRCKAEIDRVADDYNELKHYIYVAHSNELGVLPEYVSFGDYYDLIPSDTSLNNGDKKNSGWWWIWKQFDVNAGVCASVQLAACTELKAQDGMLRMIGRWSVSDLYYSIWPKGYVR